MKHSLILAALAVSVAACAVDPATSTEPSALKGECAALICGNTGVVGGYPFWELDETGAAFSHNGFRIKRVTRGGITYRPDVQGFRLMGTPVGGGAPVHLIGSQITIETDTGTTSYELSLAKGTSVHYYEDGDDGTSVPTYRITYVEIDGGRRGPVKDLCGPNSQSSVARDAIVFQGDRFDAVTGELIATGAGVGGWFNITCKDDALWKLALFRHVEVASLGAYETKPHQRMAALRAIRADYCGVGEPYTKPGTAVDWVNVGAWLTIVPGLVPEAIWNGDRAVCLDTPRLVDRDDVACELPTCDAMIDDWTIHGSMVTYVPAAP